LTPVLSPTVLIPVVFRFCLHQGLVLCPSCVPEKGGINQTGMNKNYIPIRKKKTSINGNKPTKLKVGGHKL
jgi:hypothetical protein